MSPIKLGSSLKKPSTCVTPTPRQMEVAAMSVLRWSMPASCIMRTPDIIIEPNMMTVQPPSTQSGSVDGREQTAEDHRQRADHDAVILRGRRKTGGEEREADAHDDRQT